MMKSSLNEWKNFVCDFYAQSASDTVGAWPAGQDGGGVGGPPSQKRHRSVPEVS
jgi:hypothetical protein